MHVFKAVFCRAIWPAKLSTLRPQIGRETGTAVEPRPAKPIDWSIPPNERGSFTVSYKTVVTLSGIAESIDAQSSWKHAPRSFLLAA